MDDEQERKVAQGPYRHLVGYGGIGVKRGSGGPEGVDDGGGVVVIPKSSLDSRFIGTSNIRPQYHSACRVLLHSRPISRHFILLCRKIFIYCIYN